ncbi:MAG: hypothetical protein IJF01_05395 [Tidjanibacter sp.]|nr:hypothetical protein [Tidjanibacter sp.]
MKKLLYLFGAMALMAGMVACGEKNEGPGNLDDAIEVGFYVIGDAVGVNEIVGEAMMGAGYNENGPEKDDQGNIIDAAAKRGQNQLRSGMYEKYVWLEAGKEFEIVYFDGEEQTRYGSALEDNVENKTSDSDFPSSMSWAKVGDLEIGADAPALKVEETGLYHIVLDDASNVQDKADFPLIMVIKVDWGVRGDCNGWGWTKGEFKNNGDGSYTWTWTEQALKSGQKFKFAYNGGWKIALDVAAKIKANTNLGWTTEDGSDKTLLQGGKDIIPSKEEHGYYKITLTYKMGKGAHGNSFTYTAEKTGVLEVASPDNLYIIGSDFGNWTLGSDGIVEMTPVNGKEAFWAVRYMTTSTAYKFLPDKTKWDDGFVNLSAANDEGYIVDNDCFVEKDGLYLILVDYDAYKITVKPAQIYAMGPCFNAAVDGEAWLTGKAAFTVEGQTASIKVDNAGNARMYVELNDGGADWWRSEWGVTDGKIVYRGNGGSDPVTPVTAGQTITLNFNAGTATIK